MKLVDADPTHGPERACNSCLSPPSGSATAEFDSRTEVKPPSTYADGFGRAESRGRCRTAGFGSGRRAEEDGILPRGTESTEESREPTGNGTEGNRPDGAV